MQVPVEHTDSRMSTRLNFLLDSLCRALAAGAFDNCY